MSNDRKQQLSAISSNSIDDTTIETLKILMKKAKIPGMSIAAVTDGKVSGTATIGLADQTLKTTVTQNSRFWAGSLSKPVFAYLVFTLAEKGLLGVNFDLDKTQLYKIWDDPRFKDAKERESLTASRILSHQTGLLNWSRRGALDFKFKPGDGYIYSGEAYYYLQRVIEKITKRSLESLAKEFVFDKFKMTQSSFLMPNADLLLEGHSEAMVPLQRDGKMMFTSDNAAGSLHTTSRDYALFIAGILKDEKFIKYATNKLISTETDLEARQKGVSYVTLRSIGWGLGVGLQKSDESSHTIAFHWGDCPGVKSFLAINLTSKDAVVYFTNSDNGLAIARDAINLFSHTLNVQHAVDYLVGKYGYKNYYELSEIQVANEDPKIAYRRKIWLRDLTNAKIHPIVIEKEKLKEYIGEYGTSPLLKIVESKGMLQLEFRGQIFNLIPVTNDKLTFALQDDLTFRIEFSQNKKFITSHFLNNQPSIEEARKVSFKELQAAPAQLSKSNESKLPDFNSMSFEDFDQKEHGVRSLAKAGDFKAAGEAISSYISANNAKLTPAERCLLWFHAGQNAALQNRNAEALAFFKKSCETIPDEKNPNKLNYAIADFFGPATEFYLKATLMFIENRIIPKPDNVDIAENIKIMQESLREMQKIPLETYPRSSVVYFPGRVNDMCQASQSATYADVWKLPPSLPPLPGKTIWYRIHVPKDHPEQEGKMVEDYKSELKEALKIAKMEKKDEKAPSEHLQRKDHLSKKNF